MEKDFFHHCRKIIFIFFIFAIILIMAATFSHRSLFFDAPAMFSQILLQENGHKNYFIFIEHRTRLFSSFLLVVPYNIIVRFIKDIPLYKIDLFAFSYQFSLLCALAFNYILAKRTKKYDIPLLALIFYTFFYLPNSVWYVKELHIAIMLQFALLQYFLTTERFSKVDYLITFLLIAYCFESYENSPLFGFILFVSSFLFKNFKNKKEKIFIGTFGLINAFYVTLKTYLGISGGSANISFSEAFDQYFTSLKITLERMFNGDIILSWLGFLFIVATLFSKRKFQYKEYIIVASIMFSFTFFIFQNYMPDPKIELHYFIIPFLLFAPIALATILCNYFGLSTQEYVKSNIVKIVCLTGICHILLQINSCVYSFKYFKLFKEKLLSENTFEKINDKDFNNPALIYNTDFGQEFRSIILYPEKTIKTIIISDDSDLKCDIQNNIFYIGNSELPIKTKYWDLHYIAENLKKDTNYKNF